MSLVRRLPWFAVPLGIFLLSRLVDAVLIVLVARRQVDASVLDPSMPMPTLVDPATYGHVIANWDGQWYHSIVEHGYPRHLPTKNGVVQENAWAFYPMFPALVRIFTATGLAFGAAASVVSLTAGAAAICLLHRLLRTRCSEYVAALTVLAICFAPAAPILQAAYSDSLGLLLLVVALICVERRRHGWLLVVGLLLALTRPITLPLVVVTAAEFLRRWRRRDSDPFPVRERVELAGVTAALVAFAGLWPAVTGLVVGDWSAYSKTQHAWRVDVAGSGADTWLSSLVHGTTAPRWVFVVLVVGGSVLIAWRSRHWTPGLRVWTAAYPLFILASTPVTFSLVRYGVMVGPAWWPFGEVDGRIRSRRLRVSLLAAVAVGGILVQLVWLNWFFVITPNNHGIP